MNTNDRVKAIIEQYVSYLDGQGDAPSLDHLTPDERKLARELMASMETARGMDPEASPPSLEQLLADSKYFDQLRTSYEASPTQQPDIEEVRQQLASLPAARVELDAVAKAVGVRSNFVIFVKGHRLRMQVRDDFDDIEALRAPSTVISASPVFGAFHDTAGVVVSFPDNDLSSLVVDPFDAQYCIEAPSGDLKGPRVRRPVLPVAEAIRGFLEEIAPPFETIPTFHTLEPDSDLGFDPLSISSAAVAAVSDTGRRARIEAKKEAWGALGRREAEAIAETIVRAARGELDENSLSDRVLELARMAS